MITPTLRTNPPRASARICAHISSISAAASARWRKSAA